MKRFPALSIARAPGSLSAADEAGSPSPLKPFVPLPATVLIIPVAASTRRTRRVHPSAMKRFPAPSTAIPTIHKYAEVGMAVDGAGNLFIADGCTLRVRRVDAATGIIST